VAAQSFISRIKTHVLAPNRICEEDFQQKLDLVSPSPQASFIVVLSGEGKRSRKISIAFWSKSSTPSGISGIFG